MASMARWLIPLTLGLLLCAAPAAAQETDMTGLKAPDFTLSGTDGKPYVLSDLYRDPGGLPQLLGSTVRPCVQEIPILNRMAKTLCSRRGSSSWGSISTASTRRL